MAASRELAPPCGPTHDDAECNCGCTGYDDRCAYFMYVYDETPLQVEQHYCCAIPGR